MVVVVCLSVERTKVKSAPAVEEEEHEVQASQRTEGRLPRFRQQRPQEPLMRGKESGHRLRNALKRRC